MRSHREKTPDPFTDWHGIALRFHNVGKTPDGDLSPAFGCRKVAPVPDRISTDRITDVVRGQRAPINRDANFPCCNRWGFNRYGLDVTKLLSVNPEFLDLQFRLLEKRDLWLGEKT